MSSNTAEKEKSGRTSIFCQIYNQFGTEVTFFFTVVLILLCLYKTHFLKYHLILKFVKSHTLSTPMLL